MASRTAELRIYIAGLCDTHRPPFLFGLALFSSIWLGIIIFHPPELKWDIVVTVTLYSIIFLGIFFVEFAQFLRFNFLLLTIVFHWLVDILVFACKTPRYVFSIFYVVRLPRYQQLTQLRCLPEVMPDNDELCSVCERVIDQSALITGTKWIFTRPIEKHHYHTPRDLLTSAKSCHLCHLLLNSIDPSGQHLSPEPTQQYGSIPVSPSMSNREKISVTVREKRLLHGNSSLYIQLCSARFPDALPLRVEEIQNDLLIQQCYLSPDTGSKISLDHAKAWIKSCHGHDLCKDNSSQTHYFPTRALEINQKDPQNVRLVTLSDYPASYSAPYFALSHCWGGSIKTQLHGENYEALKKSISVQNLPKNFQDAISISHRLGVCYLWIDSLCIIQDSHEDWVRESAKMGLVYANALCTISATASKSSDGGCFLSKLYFMTDCVLRRKKNTSLIVRSWARDEISLAYLFQEKVEMAPLSNRAWAFQERLLSRRVLHFCDGLILFECNTLQASEYHIDGILYPRKVNVRYDGQPTPLSHLQRLCQSDEPYRDRVRSVKVLNRTGSGKGTRIKKIHETIRNSSYKSPQEKISQFLDLSARFGIRGAFDMLLRSSRASMTAKEGFEFHQSWYDIVEQYSSRSLTNHEDKMMAICGIADIIQQKTGIQFIAGLWLKSLPFNLLWAVLRPCKSRPSRSVPSWSWASVDGRIIHLLKVSATEEANLRVKGFIPSSSSSSEITAYLKAVNEIHYMTEWEQTKFYVSVEAVEPTLEYNSLIHRATLKMTGYLCDIDLAKVKFIPDVHVDTNTGASLLSLPILSFKNIYVDPVGSLIQLHGIVVQAKPGTIATYMRVGYFWTSEQVLVEDVVSHLEYRSGFCIV